MGLKSVGSRALATQSLFDLGQIINLSMPQFPCLQHWNNDNTFLTGLM